MSSLDLQKAIVSMLDGVLSCPVYDDVPDDAQYPYVAVDADLVSNSRALGQYRETVMVYLSIWSDYAGRKEVKQIADTIRTTTENTRPAMDAGVCENLRFERVTTSKDVDGTTYTGRVTLRAIIRP
ncbi:MAG: DUF3168 domain-containing protein [Thalassospira sp.]|jgi:hypothetical protein|uniref:DUF3168 domain-containing protein n=1 Tax=unclassified Thalassospira TaxID=2648997 RepID=UPI000D763CB3|nr:MULTISPECIES: DUF3168 domain-containing protein [unclassified Thalassospira]MBL4839394.1 DUF3168 domain-containing protein [Thalassospira sp.]PXX36279.1 uncharacterized protein DUF3168 [Thalassospira sp. 11-3]QPL37484.1 DUF3168 domain-containing protein [Thalassospira sp. B30-1]